MVKSHHADPSRQARVGSTTNGIAITDDWIARFAESEEEPSSRHANGDGVWDVGVQKTSKPQDMHFVMGKSSSSKGQPMERFKNF